MSNNDDDKTSEGLHAAVVIINRHITGTLVRNVSYAEALREVQKFNEKRSSGDIKMGMAATTIANDAVGEKVEPLEGTSGQEGGGGNGYIVKSSTKKDWAAVVFVRRMSSDIEKVLVRDVLRGDAWDAVRGHNLQRTQEEIKAGTMYARAVLSTVLDAQLRWAANAAGDKGKENGES